MQVDSAWSSGNYQQARSHSSIAKILNIIGIVVGSLSWIGVGIYIIYAIVTAAITASAAAATSFNTFNRNDFNSFG